VERNRTELGVSLLPRESRSSRRNLRLAVAIWMSLAREQVGKSFGTFDIISVVALETVLYRETFSRVF